MAGKRKTRGPHKAVLVGIGKVQTPKRGPHKAVHVAIGKPFLGRTANVTLAHDRPIKVVPASKTLRAKRRKRNKPNS